MTTVTAKTMADLHLVPGTRLHVDQRNYSELF